MNYYISISINYFFFHFQLPGLFKGCHIYLLGAFNETIPNKKEIEGLIKAADGIVLFREPNPESIPDKEKTVPFHTDSDKQLSKCSHYLIYQEGLCEPQLKYDMAHIKSLPFSWLINCIENFRISLDQKL